MVSFIYILDGSNSILVHLHFDQVGLLLVHFATRTVDQIATQMISSVAILLHLKRLGGKRWISLLSNTPYKIFLKFW